MMSLNNGPANMQPKAQSDPGAALDVDPLDPMKPFPDVLVFLAGQSWAFITNPDPCLLAFYGDAHRDREIGGRIFQGIGQIIRHDLPEAMGIGNDGHALPLWGTLAAACVPD